MRKALIATIIGACFVMGGGLAGASFIRYVAAPDLVQSAGTAASVRRAQAPKLAFVGPDKARDEACSVEETVCDAAFAAFMLQAVLGSNGAGGDALAALRDDAARKLAAADR